MSTVREKRNYEGQVVGLEWSGGARGEKDEGSEFGFCVSARPIERKKEKWKSNRNSSIVEGGIL